IEEREAEAQAAVRETQEEGGVVCDKSRCVLLGTWSDAKRRSHTTYFATTLESQESSPEGRQCQWLPVPQAKAVLMKKNGMSAALDCLHATLLTDLCASAAAPAAAPAESPGGEQQSSEMAP
ncbi:NUDT4A, partial [Symbiodinium sp. KB8]